MDRDLDQMSREELIVEVSTLGLLPEQTDPIPTVPNWPQFMRGCVRYRQSLDEQAPQAPRTSRPYRG